MILNKPSHWHVHCNQIPWCHLVNLRSSCNSRSSYKVFPVLDMVLIWNRIHFLFNLNLYVGAPTATMKQQEQTLVVLSQFSLWVIIISPVDLGYSLKSLFLTQKSVLISCINLWYSRAHSSVTWVFFFSHFVQLKVINVMVIWTHNPGPCWH